MITYRKLETRGDHVQEMVATIQTLRLELNCSSGRKLTPEAIAVAIVRASGCGHSAAAIARNVAPNMERSGGFIDKLADRILARSPVWQEQVVDDSDEPAACFDVDDGALVHPKPSSSRKRTVSAPRQDAAEREPSRRSRRGAAPQSDRGSGPASSNASSTSVCAVCDMPPPSSPFWSSFTSADLGNCSSCYECNMPRVPRSCDEMIMSIAEEHGPLPDHYDHGRIAPRPHEHALWSADESTRAMRDLLLRGQHSLPFGQIVALADSLRAAETRQPLQVECQAMCKKRRNFDFLYGAFVRMRRCTNRETKYVGAASIRSFMDEVVPAAVKAIQESAGPVNHAIPWIMCCNCETSIAFEERRALRRATAIDTAERIGLRQHIQAAWPLGCPLTIPRDDMTKIPLKGGEVACLPPVGTHPQPATCGVLILRRELVAECLQFDRTDFTGLIGEPSVRHLFAPPVDFGGELHTRAAAGGAEVNTALLLLSPSTLIAALQAISVQEQRCEHLRACLRREDSGCEAVGVASLDADLPSAKEVEAEAVTFFAQRSTKRLRGHEADDSSSLADIESVGKCETGRPGRPESWASLMRNPDVISYGRMRGIPGGQRHTDHMLFISQPNAPHALHVLMLYVAGPRGRPSPCISAKTRDGAGTQASKKLLKRLQNEREATDAQRARLGKKPLSVPVGADQPEDVQLALAPIRIAYGQPRTMEAGAGRHFLDATHVEAQQLQEAEGPNAHFHFALSKCGVWAMCILATLGLAPAPTDDATAWVTRRTWLLLGDSVALTAQYTWTSFSNHTTVELAIISLACVQGFYRNKYPAFCHFDTNRYGETWTLLRSEEAAAWARAAGLDVLPTHVPQLFVALHTTPNKTVWTAFLQHILHAAGEQPDSVVARPLGWKPSRGAGELFALQARGTKDYGSGQYHIWTEQGTGAS